MGRKKLRLGISGVTINDKTVVHNVYKICESIGTDLTDVLMLFKENDMVVDWAEYYNDALKAKMKSSRILMRIRTSVADAYDVEHSKKVIKLLEIYIENN